MSTWSFWELFLPTRHRNTLMPISLCMLYEIVANQYGNAQKSESCLPTITEKFKKQKGNIQKSESCLPTITEKFKKKKGNIIHQWRLQPVWILRNLCPRLVQKCKILNFKIKEKLIANSESEWTKSSHETPKHTLLRTWYSVQTSSTSYQPIKDQTYKLPTNNNKRVTIGPVNFLEDYKQIEHINSLGKNRLG